MTYRLAEFHLFDSGELIVVARLCGSSKFELQLEGVASEREKRDFFCKVGLL